MAAFAPTSTTQGVWQIEQIYIGYFGRAADAAGYDFWQGEYNARTNGTYKIAGVVQPKQTAADAIASIASSFGASGQTETVALYPFLGGTVSLPSTDNVVKAQITSFVNAVYQNLFSRAPDAAGQAYWVNQIATGAFSTSLAILTIANAAGADGSTQSLADAKVLNNKLAVADNFLYTTAVANIGASGNVPTSVIQQAKAVLTSVDSTDASVTAANTAQAAWLAGGAGAPATNLGQSFVLTTGTDIITGTSGNDTIIGDFTAPATANAGDQINGGAGTDTLKIYGTFALGSLPVSITNVEVLNIANTAAADINLTGWAKAATGIATVALDNASLLTANTITTTAGQALSLATGAANVATTGLVTWAASATDTSLSLTLNGYQGGKGVVAQALTITGAADKTLNIASTGASNAVSTLTIGAVTDTVVITGDKSLKITTDLVSSLSPTVLKTVDASGNSGGVSITLAAKTNSAFKFTGGAGNDTITFADDEFGTLTAGSQLDGGAGTGDKIGLKDAALTAAEYTGINATKGFEILGLNAAITVDASQLTSLKSFSLDTNFAQTINNMQAGSAVAVTKSHATNITTTSGVGVHDLALTIGTSTTTGLTVGGTVAIGQDQVTLASLGDGTGVNTITGLTAANNSVYTITGANDLTITAITAAATSGSKYDASAFTGKLTIAGNGAAFSAGSSLGDIIIGGSKDDTIKVGLNSSIVTGNGGNDTFDVSAAVAAAAPGAGLASASTIDLTTITDFTKGDILKFGATAGAFSAAKVDLSAAANLGAALDLLVAGANTDLKWGIWNGNTYIADDVDAGATVAATDTIVKLTGALDLSTSTFAAGTNTLTFA